MSPMEFALVSTRLPILVVPTASQCTATYNKEFAACSKAGNWLEVKVCRQRAMARYATCLANAHLSRMVQTGGTVVGRQKGK